MKRLKDMTEPELNDYFLRLARMVEDFLPPGPSNKGKCLFFVVVADETGPGIGQYVGNIARPDAIKLMRETADRIERNEDVRRDPT